MPQPYSIFSRIYCEDVASDLRSPLTLKQDALRRPRSDGGGQEQANNKSDRSVFRSDEPDQSRRYNNREPQQQR